MIEQRILTGILSNKIVSIDDTHKDIMMKSERNRFKQEIRGDLIETQLRKGNTFTAQPSGATLIRRETNGSSFFSMTNEDYDTKQIELSLKSNLNKSITENDNSLKAIKEESERSDEFSSS